MKIVIVGPGAMGCLFASFFFRAGYDVWLMDYCQERAGRIKSQGLHVEGISGDYHLPFKQITTQPEIIGKADLIIIFVKAYDTEKATRDVQKLVFAETHILTLQNGIGNIAKIRAGCPGIAVLAGATAHGATLLGDGHIRHAGTGETTIGLVDKTAAHNIQSIIALFARADIPTSVTENVMGMLWGKLLVNVGINPITAIMKIKNGEILGSLNLIEVMRRAVEEGVMVAQTLDIELPYVDTVEKVKEVCRLTAGNCSSMLQDILRGKKTEIEYMNGAIVAYGKQLSINIPVNSLLLNLVIALEGLQTKLTPRTIELA